MPDSRHGLAFGAGSYLLWGLFPLYWPLLEPSSAVEILAHRIVWTFVAILPLVALWGQRGWWSALRHDRRPLLLLVPAAALIAVNWGIYIWGVNNGHVVDISLGSFVNPLVTCALGVVLLRERLRWAQWFALGVGVVAVVALTADYGRPPWVALVLAGSFGCNSLLKKTAGAGAVDSLAVESTALLLPALGYVAFLVATGAQHVRARLGRPHRAAGVRGTGGRGAAAAVRCGGAAAAAVDARDGAVPRAGAAVPVRRAAVPRADAADPPRRLRSGVSGAGAAHPDGVRHQRRSRTATAALPEPEPEAAAA